MNEISELGKIRARKFTRSILKSMEDNQSTQMHNRISIVTILTIITLITTIVMFNDQLSMTSSDDAKSILPDYRGGYEVGIMQGIQDQRSGKGHNDSCPPVNYGILWCIGYEIGYNKGYYDNSDTLEGK